jgi:ABC-type nickel/cobalt efflux system permease component RcnA
VKLLGAVLVAAAALLVLPALASAHPLGNFTTNSYAEVVASGDRIYVVTAVDLAEIPTFQAEPDVTRRGRDAYARKLAASVRRGLELRADGERRSLVEIERRLTFPPGAASLSTTRLEAVFDAGALPAGEPVTLELENRAFASRIGWKELVVRAERGAKVETSDVAGASRSDRLRDYPASRLESPLAETGARAIVRGSSAEGLPPGLGGPSAETARTVGAGEGGFASLIGRDEAGAGFVLLALGLALFWGAAHALTPGHGKAIVAAYLVGTKGRARDALALGAIVTVTHTIGVFALGIATLALSEFVVPEDLYPWLNLISALLVVAVGVTVLRQRVGDARGAGAHQHHHHDHDHHHHHDHDELSPEEHAHAHLPAAGSGRRGLLAVGVSGGLLPCPTALVVLLAAISLHQVAFGLVLIVAFSAGLAAVIAGIGLLAVGARRTFRRLSLEGPVVRALPAVSALLVLGIGVVMTLRALPQVA